MRGILVAVTLGALVSGSAQAHHPAGNVRTAYDGPVSGPVALVPGPKYLALETPEELDLFYQLHLPDQRLPAIDFETSMALTVVSGYGPQTDPRIVHFERTVGTALDLLVVTVDKRGCETCTALANDVHVAIVERYAGVVVFGTTDSGVPAAVDVVAF